MMDVDLVGRRGRNRARVWSIQRNGAEFLWPYLQGGIVGHRDMNYQPGTNEVRAWIAGSKITDRNIAAGKNLARKAVHDALLAYGRDTVTAR